MRERRAVLIMSKSTNKKVEKLSLALTSHIPSNNPTITLVCFQKQLFLQYPLTTTSSRTGTLLRLTSGETTVPAAPAPTKQQQRALSSRAGRLLLVGPSSDMS